MFRENCKKYIVYNQSHLLCFQILDYINNSICKLSFTFPINSFSNLFYFTIVSEARRSTEILSVLFFENLKIEQISNSELLNIFKKRESGKYKCSVSKLVIVINLLSSYSHNDLFIFAKRRKCFMILFRPHCEISIF